MGWSSGLKMMQSTLQAKKVAKKLETLQSPSSMGPPKIGSAPTFAAINKHRTFSSPILAPVIDLKSKKSAVLVEEPLPTSATKTQFSKPESRGSSAKTVSSGQIGIQSFNEPNFQVTNEYDPHWPNDYHKVILEMRGDKKKEDDNDATESKKRKYSEDGRAKARERFSREDSGAGGNGTGDTDRPRGTDSPTGFGRRPRDDYDDEDEEDSMDRRRKANASSRRSQGSTTGGAAIAPPPSLTETNNPASMESPSTSSSPPPPKSTSELAAENMAKTIKKSPFAALMRT